MPYTQENMIASSSEISVTIYTTLQGVTSHKTVIFVVSFGTSTIIDEKIGFAEKIKKEKEKIPKGPQIYI